MRWLFWLIFLIPATGLCGEPRLSQGQLLYVPVYSHIYIGDRERPFNLAVTLSVRNTDPRKSLRLTEVDYYDSDGHLVRHYLEEPREMPPLATIRPRRMSKAVPAPISWSAGSPPIPSTCRWSSRS
jgi:hypothetical protein